MRSQSDARIPTTEKTSVSTHNILSHSDNASCKLAYINAAKLQIRQNKGISTAEIINTLKQKVPQKNTTL